MYSKIIKESKLNIYNRKKLLLFLVIAMGIICPLNLISKPLTQTKFNDANILSDKSFVTKAIERTGSSVVTIDTQRYIKKKISKKILNYF